jgi:ABC-type transporter MlaC component
MKTYISALAIALLLIFTGNVLADAKDPADSLQTTLDKISAFHKTKSRHNTFVLRHFIEQEIMPRFSFQQMTHWVAGPYARNMTADDKTAFAAQLRTDFLNMLIEHLGNFDPDRYLIQIDKARYLHPGLATVAMRASIRQQLQPITLSFRMQRIQHLWKIVDIQSNGLSLVMYYRARYISQLRGYQSVAQ